MILLVKWSGKHIHSPPEPAKIKSLVQNLFIFFASAVAGKKTTFQLIWAFMKIYSFACWHAHSGAHVLRESCAAESQLLFH